MKRTVTTYTNKNTGIVYTLIAVDENKNAVVLDSNLCKRSMNLETLKKSCKKETQEVDTKMTPYRVIFADAEGIKTSFELLNTDNFLIAERTFEKRLRKADCSLLKCEPWFE